MSSHSPVCPRCGESLPEAAESGPSPACPRCDGGAKARRRLSPISVAVLALAGLAWTGVVFYTYSPVLFPTKVAAAPKLGPTAPPAPRPARAKDPAKAKEEIPAWTHSRLLVVRPEKGADRRPVVVLGRPTGATQDRLPLPIQKGILTREIVRQAVLLAARDELGLPTRDEVLGDPAPDGKGDAAADLAYIVRNSNPAGVMISREGAEEGGILDRELHPGWFIHEPQDLAEAAEKMSRTEFPKALKALGLEGKPNAVRPDAPLPDAVEAQLDDLGFVAPLAAVRATHEAIRKDGESPARLGALVRGYANLGVLNEGLWSPVHKVFKARALLYARRLTARDPDSPMGPWHRAYAEAMTGLHKKAIEDLSEAESLARRPGAPKAPAWVETIAAYCHYDLARLRKAEGRQAKLAALLRLLALEFPHHSQVPLRAAGEVLALDPACFRAIDVMYQVGGVSNLHVVTMHGPQALSQAVPEKIRALVALPEAAREPIDRNAGEVALVEALERAGRPGEDDGEPSWAVLGSLVRETRFLLVQQRLYFMAYLWSVPVEDFWNEARPLVARHRFQPYLLTIAFGTPEADQAFAESLDETRLADLEFNEAPMTVRLRRFSEATGLPAWHLAQQHMDHLARDFATQCDFYNVENKQLWNHNGKRILDVSPEDPYGMAIRIESDWENIQPQLADWEKKGDEFPAIVGALGRRYSDLREYDRARAYLERFIAASPEKWAFERLARDYRAQGNNAQWLATLDRYLAVGEDPGLDQARVRVEIANYYMAKRQWEKAQPYAEAAAETWAAWAMQCAAQCYEGMSDWEHAELWARRLSERYPNSSLQAWLDFCKRTGHGDAEAARALVEQYLGPDGAAIAADAAELAGPLAVGYAAWQKGATKEAMATLRKAYQAGINRLQAGCALMVLSDEAGDTAQRDAILADLCNRHKARSPKVVAVLQLFRDAFARGARALPDPKALDRALEDVAPKLRGNTEFFAGWLLKDRGRRADAEIHLRRCVESASGDAWLKQIAADALARLDAEPEAKP